MKTRKLAVRPITFDLLPAFTMKESQIKAKPVTKVLSHSVIT